MPQPREHRFAVTVIGTQFRAPTGLSTFPDGGKPRVLRQVAKLWLCDPERRWSRRLTLLERPPAIRSGFTTWIVGWDSTGDYRSIYMDVRGHAGETSDTELLRYLVKVEVGPDTSRAMSVSYIPTSAAQPRGPGPLREGRELQVGAGDTMLVRTDVDPEWRPAFRLDPETGDVVAIEPPGAAPPATGAEVPAP